MARHTSLATISNPLITAKQLLAFRQHHQSQAEADTLIFKISLLTQAAGVLLRLPQEVIAASIIILQRYLTLASHEATPERELPLLDANFTTVSTLIKASSAAIYLSAKQSFYPLSPRSIINVYTLLTSPISSPLYFVNASASNPAPSNSNPDTTSYHVTEGTYQTQRIQLFSTESQVLSSLGFDTKVVLPYSLALTYIQALSASISALSERTLAHLNAALLSPQLLYLTHQPNALAVASIYLAARETGVALVDDGVAWWEVFDVGREELGFLVLSLGSLNGYVAAQQESG